MAWMKQNARERAVGALRAAAERLNDLELAHLETSTTTYLMIASQVVEQSFKAVMVAKGERRIAEGGNQGRYSEWVGEEKITKVRASEIAHAICEYSRRRVRGCWGTTRPGMRHRRHRPAKT